MRIPVFIFLGLSCYLPAESQVYVSNNTFDNSIFSSATGYNNKTGAFGANNVYYSLASGSTNRVLPGANSSVVLGDNSYVGGYASFAAGSFSAVNINSNNSFAFGQWVTASASNAMIIGTGRWSSTAYANNFSNNIANSLMVSFNNTTAVPSAPSLFVGPIGTYNGYTYNLGCVGVGTTDTKGNLFAVNGNMVVSQLKVASYASWPDYVFEKKYPLLSIGEVEQFINKNHHLPGMDNANSINSGGYDVAEMDAKLLKNIEEIYLHLIDLKEQTDVVKNKINLLDQKVKIK